MKEQRSSSQILFGFLPDQTVDIGGGVWKVKHWTDPKIERNVDSEALRDELIRLSWKWSEERKDGGFVDDLRSGRSITVKSLNRDRGVWCESFPRNWVCKKCSRVFDSADARCECGFRGKKGQLAFVGYHDVCGAIKQPWIPKCRAHKQVAVKFPGTASADEILFYCPICKAQIRKGLAGAMCDCVEGGRLRFTVHRAAAVFTPRPIVLVNPPRRDSLDRLKRAGGSAAALDWVLGGLKGRWIEDDISPSSPEATRRVLLAQGLDPSVIEKMISAMAPSNKSSGTQSVSASLSPIIRIEAESQAQIIALALQKSRITLEDVKKAAPQDSDMGSRYAAAYPDSYKLAGVERVELVDAFPVLTGQYGYTRGDQEPGKSRLRAFRERDGSYTVYADVAETEALFVRLSPQRVLGWLNRNGCGLPEGKDDTEAATIILDASESPLPGVASSGNNVGRLVTTLIHSYAHKFIREISVFAGIERSSISELLVPLHLGFFVYAAARGDFVLGGLQAVFENELDELLKLIVAGEHRCPLDPGCAEHGASCAICLHLGEPSCRLFNTMLSRDTLGGSAGYLNVVN